MGQGVYMDIGAKTKMENLEIFKKSLSNYGKLNKEQFKILEYCLKEMLYNTNDLQVSEFCRSAIKQLYEN